MSRSSVWRAAALSIIVVPVAWPPPAEARVTSVTINCTLSLAPSL